MYLPDVEEVGDVRHLEVEFNGVDESLVSIQVEPIYLRVRQLGLRWHWRLFVRVIVAVFVIRRLSHVSVLLPRPGRRRRRRESHEAQDSHDGFKLFVSHNGIECFSLP